MTETYHTIDLDSARRLVERQFPQWARLPMERLVPGGSDHVIYRLGSELSVRFPRHAGAIGQAAKEARWLPQLAAHLPLAVPEPVAVGDPDLDYPWPWAVSRWLSGETATVQGLAESSDAAGTLAEFLRALQGFTPAPAPAPADPPTPTNPQPPSHPPTADASGELAAQPLADRNAETRTAIAAVDGVFDAAALTKVWDAALEAPEWDRPAVWFHGDFHTGNLLTVDGRLSAVIDFGGLGLGDPACDLTIAYTLLTARTRAVFRDALGLDEAAWTRGRGWALATGLNAYTSYAETNPRVAEQTTRQIREALIG